MAYGGLQGQTPQGVAPINGLPTNDVRELTVRSGYDISAGDVVDVEGGEVFKTATTKPIVTSSYNNPNIFDSITKDKFLSYEYITGNLKINILNMQNPNSPQVIKSYNIPSTQSSKQPSKAKITKMSVGRYMVSFYENVTYGYRLFFEFKIDSSENMSHISLGKISNFTAFDNSFQIKLDDDTILFTGSAGDSSQKFRRLKISTKQFSDISTNSFRETVVSVTSLGNNLFICGSDDLGDYQSFLLYQYTGTAFNRKAILGLSEYDEPIDFIPLENNKFVAIYTQGGMGYPEMMTCAYTLSSITKITNKSLSIGESPSGSWGNSNPGFSKVGNDIVLMLAEPQTKRSIIEKINISSDGKTIQELNRTEVFKWEDKLDNQPGRFTIMPINNSTFFCQSTRGSYSATLGSATISIYNNQFVGEVLDTSKDAIALQSASSNQPISVGFGGYCECPNVTEGQTITSSGVMGYGVQDGWLDVRPAYNSMITSSIVTGNFTATNKSIKNIELGFKPKLVICYTKNNNTSDIAGGSDGLLSGQSAPRILTSAYEDNNYGKIEKTGFSFKCYASSMQVYYIAFR